MLEQKNQPGQPPPERDLSRTFTARRPLFKIPIFIDDHAFFVGNATEFYIVKYLIGCKPNSASINDMRREMDLGVNISGVHRNARGLMERVNRAVGENLIIPVSRRGYALVDPNGRVTLPK